MLDIAELARMQQHYRTLEVFRSECGQESLGHPREAGDADLVVDDEAL